MQQFVISTQGSTVESIFGFDFIGVAGTNSQRVRDVPRTPFSRHWKVILDFSGILGALRFS